MILVLMQGWLARDPFDLAQGGLCAPPRFARPRLKPGVYQKTRALRDDNVGNGNGGTSG